MKTYQNGQNLKLIFKDRMEDPTSWNCNVQVDVEEVTAQEIENYFENSILIDVEIVESDYSSNPLSQIKKNYK